MAHFAKITETNEVLTILYVNDSDTTNGKGVEEESVGQAYLEKHNNWPAHLWIKISFNTIHNTHKKDETPFRGNYVGTGATWDEINQIFWHRIPHPNWVKDLATASWKSPIGDAPELTAEQLADVDNKYFYTWEESSDSWMLRTITVAASPELTEEQKLQNTQLTHSWRYEWNESTQTWDLTNAIA